MRELRILEIFSKKNDLREGCVSAWTTWADCEGRPRAGTLPTQAEHPAGAPCGCPPDRDDIRRGGGTTAAGPSRYHDHDVVAGTADGDRRGGAGDAAAVRSAGPGQAGG